MNKLIISLVVAFSCLALASAGIVKPEKKLYFTIPLGQPAAAAATTAAATTAAATTAATTAASDTTTAASSDSTTASSDTTTAGSTDSTTAAPASPAIQVIPLGQLLGYFFQGTFLGNILQGIFGTALPDGSQPTSVGIRPLFQALGSLFG